MEKFAVDRAIRSIRDCDVALLVIDAKEGISDQDKKIASIITDAGKGMVIAINKWDLIEDKKSNTINKFEKMLSNEIPFLNYVPKIYISAKTKQRLVKIYKLSKEVYAEADKTLEYERERTEQIKIAEAEKLRGEKDYHFIAVEPASCPSFTRGVYAYDFCDTGDNSHV